MEYAKDAKKHIIVMAEEMIQPDFGSTNLFQASIKDLELVSLQTLPMELKV